MMPADTLSLPRARQLAGLADAAHIPHDVARMACVELGRACDEVERLGAALDVARSTIARLNRRAQAAEAIADRCVAGRPVTGPGLGRALANYAASRLAEVAAAALDGWDRAVSLRPDTPEEREELWRTLDALTGTGGEARATLAGMTTPTLPPLLSSLAAVAYAACRAPGSPAWERLDAPNRDRIAGRLLYGYDYLAGGEGMAKGVIYSASPTDPLPVLPEP